MTEPALSEPRTDGPRKAASLTSIAVPRRRSAASPASGKAGDLTQPAAPFERSDDAVQVVPDTPPPDPILAWSTRPALAAPEPDDAQDFVPLEPAEAPEASRCAGEIMAYWNKLRRGRPFPALDELDREFVGTGWQDSMIVDFAGAPAMPHIARLGRPSGAVAYMPLMTDWILSRGRQAARRGVALDEIQRFEGDGETQSYRLLLLPLGTTNGASDCVLCHLSSDPESQR